jgi:hypothetical protein
VFVRYYLFCLLQTCYDTGLNRDKWHNVTVTIDVHRARLIAKVDSKQAETSILGLHPSTNYGVSSDLPSVVLIGGKVYLYHHK